MKNPFFSTSNKKGKSSSSRKKSNTSISKHKTRSISVNAKILPDGINPNAKNPFKRTKSDRTI